MTNPEYALVPVDLVLLIWADEIICIGEDNHAAVQRMLSEHEARLDEASAIHRSDPANSHPAEDDQQILAMRPVLFILALILSGCCTVGRLDSDHLRPIPCSEVHRMDDKGFPAGLFH